MAKDILGEALLDFQNGNYTEDIETIMTLNSQWEAAKDSLPLPYLFRTFEEMPLLEKKRYSSAMEGCSILGAVQEAIVFIFKKKACG